MANNREKALKIIAQRREDAENQAEQRRRELEAVSPELRDVDERISRAGFQAFRAAANGQGGKAALERLHQETIELEKRQRAILEELGRPRTFWKSTIRAPSAGTPASTTTGTANAITSWCAS